MTRDQAIAECRRLMRQHHIELRDVVRQPPARPPRRVRGAGFAAVGLGRDLFTGKPWGLQ